QRRVQSPIFVLVEEVFTKRLECAGSSEVVECLCPHGLRRAVRESGKAGSGRPIKTLDVCVVGDGVVQNLVQVASIAPLPRKRCHVKERVMHRTGAPRLTLTRPWRFSMMARCVGWRWRC